MSFSTLDVNITRQRLITVLGEDSQKYFSILRAWFSLKLTKEDFDREAKKLIPTNLVNLHNDFLLAMLCKCQSLCRPVVLSKPRNSASFYNSEDLDSKVEQIDMESKPYLQPKILKMEQEPEPVKIVPVVKERPPKPRVKMPRLSFENRHQPLDPIDVLKALKYPTAKFTDNAHPPLSYCQRDLMLPDTAMIHGRMLVLSWDYGLDGVTDDAVKLLILAVQHQLRAILSSVITRRKPYKLRDGCQYAIGEPIANPWLHNTWLLCDSNGERNATEVTDATDPFCHVPGLRPTLAEVERQAALNEACAVYNPKSLPPICMLELFETLLHKQQVLPAHSIYTVNMERIASKLWHPS